jgi:3-oxoacyl-[acyl-carrier-protein] synthase-3
MGVLIKSVATSLSTEIQSSIAHAVAASQDCIQFAKIPVEEINLLLNVGVYRDSNMVEPAMSALIQKELGLNLDYVKNGNQKAAISFDLMNGACGPLNAVQVAGAFLATGSARYVLIVSSDAHPSNQKGIDFHFGTLGAAMLLEWCPQEDKGFGKVHIHSDSDDFLGLESYTELYQPQSKGQLTLQQSPEYQSRLLASMTQAIRKTVEAEKIGLEETLFITSQIHSGFAVQIAKNLGIEEASVVRMSDFDYDPHSSTMAFGYDQAMTSGIDSKFKQILFAAGGSGLSSACAVYRR